MPLIVYVLFRETNTGHTDESDGYVEGVYANEADAEAARLAAIRQARDAGEDIYWDPDGDADQPGNDEWEHDWRVEPHQLIGAGGDSIVAYGVDSGVGANGSLFFCLAIPCRETAEKTCKPGSDPLPLTRAQCESNDATNCERCGAALIGEAVRA